MLKVIPKAPSFILTTQLHQRLIDEGYTVTKRTVERDLQALSNIMGLVYGDSPEGFKWSYDITNTELLPNMSASEALLLTVAQQQLSHSLPENSISQLEPRFNKAKEVLSTNTKYANWNSRISVLHHGLPLIRHPLNECIREAIYQAVLGNSKIKLLYKKNRDEPSEEYLLSPRGLIVRDYLHYLVATKDDSPNKFQLFNLSKVEKVSETFHLIPNNDADLQAYFDSNPSGFVLEKDQLKLSLIAGGPLAQLLSDNALSEDQTFTWLNDKPTWAKVTATVFITFDLVHLLAGYGKWSKVEEPEALIQKIKDQFV